jgi:hypothetical protein
VPMERFVSPEELLGTFKYIINSKHVSVTGQIFIVDGGQLIR